jgi:hypothetical protein
MSRHQAIAEHAVKLLNQRRAMDGAPHMLCAIDVRRTIAEILREDVESQACDKATRIAVTELRKEWA